MKYKMIKRKKKKERRLDYIVPSFNKRPQTSLKSKQFKQISIK